MTNMSKWMTSGCAALALAVCGDQAHAAPSSRLSSPGRTSLPRLTLTLKPHATDGALDYLDGTMVIHGLRVAPGKPLVRMALLVASIPTVRYDGNALTASDAQGPLPLTQKDGAPTPMGVDRDWLVDRAIEGPVTVWFRAYPRQVDKDTRPGPLFDLRAESGGLSGAGLTFLPHPLTESRYRIRLSWDMTGLPPTDRGVSCYGDGDADFVATAEGLTECYYAVGPLQVYPPGSTRDRKFGIYWLSDAPFDVQSAAAQIQTLFGYMCRFFHDQGGSYRVFIRKNPYASGGGTALHRSFMFGWNSEHPPTVEGLEGLLAHEMTHNWPALKGEHGETSWYAEGNAEYYSILLSWRAGLINADEFLKRINGRAAGYYQNPLQNLTLQQAEERYWQEANASYVPYGRGFMYLANTDAEIRAHSRGTRSLADIVVPFAERAQSGKLPPVAEWGARVTAEIGPRGQAEFADMTAGKRIIPAANAFGPCFKPQAIETRLNDLGFDEGSLRGPKKVIRGLRAGSNAALAGLRDGDEVVHRSLPDQENPNGPITLTVKRTGAQREIRFVPEGQSAEGYRWVRVAEVPDSECRY